MMNRNATRLPFGRRHLVFALGLAAIAAAFSPPAMAQGYPTKPIRLVVSFPPGAGPDILARMIGNKLSDSLGQPVITENRPGAGGNIATDLVARAPADGYTLLVASNHLNINPSLFKQLNYDPIKDFAPVTLATATPNVLVVRPSLGVKSIDELNALARAQPGKLNFSSGGNGSVGHLAGELYKTQAKVDVVHVPFKGPVEAITAVIAGNVDFAFLVAPAALPQVKSGKLLGLAVTGAKRLPALAEVPTMVESGLADYEVSAWQGILAPAGTPDQVVARLQTEVARILRLPEISSVLNKQGLEVIANTPAEFVAYNRAELAKWARTIKEANIRIN